MDKTIVKRKVQEKLSLLPPAIGRHMTLKEVHIKENGWSLQLFFEPIQDAVHADVLEVMKTWVGSDGRARFLSAEETATQTIQDMQLRGEKRTSASSLGDLDKTTNLLSMCLTMTGNAAVGAGRKRTVQRRNASLALKCFDRAQSQTAKIVEGAPKKPKVEDAGSDEEASNV